MMKLSNYIAGLQNILDENGDLECYYAKDDEGNGYQKLHYNGSVFYMHPNESCEYYPDLYQEVEEDEELFTKVVVVN
jgi:hypothetical protein